MLPVYQPATLKRGMHPPKHAILIDGIEINYYYLKQ